MCKQVGNRFQAGIMINGKKYHLGNFVTPKEAAIAYDLAAIKAKRPKCNLNFPDMVHSSETKNSKKAAAPSKWPCKWCGREFDKPNSVGGHVRHCAANPANKMKKKTKVVIKKKKK